MKLTSAQKIAMIVGAVNPYGFNVIDRGNFIEKESDGLDEERIRLAEEKRARRRARNLKQTRGVK